MSNWENQEFFPFSVLFVLSTGFQKKTATNPNVDIALFYIFKPPSHFSNTIHSFILIF